MKHDTIDAILQALGDLGYPVTLSELARVMERHLPREKLVGALAGAPYCQRDRDLIDIVLRYARDEIRGQRRPYGSNPKVVHCFEDSPYVPTIRQAQAVKAADPEPDWRRASASRLVLDAASERKEYCWVNPEYASAPAANDPIPVFGLREEDADDF
jgi:hypothetical protein